MKRIYTTVVLLFINSLIIAQNIETCSNLGPYGGYQTETWSGDNGFGTWTATDARTDQTINGKAITIRNGILTSPTITSGIGSLTLTTQRKYSGGSGNMDVRINGSSVGSIPYDATVQTTTINNINVSGSFTLVIDATNSSSDRPAIDDITWTSYSGSSNDTDSEVYDTGSQPAASTISSVNNANSSSAKYVFDMTIEDIGTSDGLATKVTNIRIKPHSTNTADWTDNIAGAVVKEGVNNIAIGTVTIDDGFINITIPNGSLDIADQTSKNISIGVYLNSSGIEDGKILSFMVDADDHGFIADATGSGFSSSFLLGDFNSNDFTIEVEATELSFFEQPTDVAVGDAISPAVEVAYVDANGNTDVDYDGAGFEITMTTTNTFDAGATTSVQPVMGVATFSNLVFTTAGTGETITADNDGWTTPQTKESDPFDIIASSSYSPGDVVINEYMANPASCGLDDDAEYIELYNSTGSAIDIDGWILKDDDSDLHTISSLNGTTTIQPGGYLVLAITSSSGAGQDYVYSSFVLANGGDEIVLLDGATEICRVNYNNGDQFGAGFSCQLPSNYDYSLADDGIILESEFTQPDTNYGCGDFGTPGSSNTLPVELLSFNVSLIAGSVILGWQTGTAKTSEFFILEWSPDGIDFTTLAQYIEVKNTREENSYEFLHKNPTKGLNYYRLTEVDRDGRETVFPVRSIRIEDAATGFVLQPNQVDNRLKVLFNIPVQNGRLQIFNTSGQLVMNQLLGDGIDVLNTDVSGLVPGQYVVRYVHAGGIETGRFVKL